MAANSFIKPEDGDSLYNPSFEDRVDKWPATIQDLNFSATLQPPPPVSKSSSYPSLERSSTSSNLSNVHEPRNLSSGHVSCNTSPEKSSGRYSGKKNSFVNSKRKQDASFANQAGDDSLKARQRIERESFQSKNLITERNRRNRIKHGLFALRALVPNISKMDMAAILGDAIEYIRELQKSVKKYQDELREMAEDCKYNTLREAPKMDREHEGWGDQPTTEINDKLSQSSAEDKKQSKVEIEVIQIGERDFLVKIVCNQRRSGFLRLMQAMDSSGLQVIDANVTTFNGSVLNILKVENGSPARDFEGFIDRAIALRHLSQYTEARKTA